MPSPSLHVLTVQRRVDSQGTRDNVKKEDVRRGSGDDFHLASESDKDALSDRHTEFLSPLKGGTVNERARLAISFANSSSLAEIASGATSSAAGGVGGEGDRLSIGTASAIAVAGSERSATSARGA